MSKYIWLEVTKDEYELPVRVAETARELAQMAGVSVRTVVGITRRRAKGINRRTRFVQVRMEEDEE